MANVSWPPTSFSTKWPPSGFATEWPSPSSGKTWPSGSVALPGAPLLWYDAQNVDGTNNSSLIDGQAVGTWVNLGSKGAGANLVQATAGIRPLFRLVAQSGKINNRSALDSVGTRWMAGSAFTAIAQPNIVAVVFKTASTGIVHTVFDGALGSNVSVDATNQIANFSGAAFSTGQFVTVGTWETEICTFNGASSFNNLNGASVGPANAGATTVTNSALFALTSGGTIMNGMIAECLVYADGTTVAAIASYLSAKYGATPQ